jgi:hypothetical protein
MSVLGISGPPPPAPPVVSEGEKSDRRTILAIILSTIVVVVGIGGTAISYWMHFSRKYAKIDHSAETLSFNLAGSRTLSTTYSNPPYGVSLMLPGKWKRFAVPEENFAGLVGSPDEAGAHFDVLFRPIFTGIPVPVESQANNLAARYSAVFHWHVQKSQRILIYDREAMEVSFSQVGNNQSLVLVMVQKGAVTYLLFIFGPPDAASSWQYLDSVLPQTIKIQ